MRNGMVSARQRSARPTRDSGSSSLQSRRSGQMPTASGLWPTPDASVANDGEDPRAWLDRADATKERVRNGNGSGMPLAVAAAMWPTPRAEDSESTGAHRSGTDTLPSPAKVEATPN